MSKRILRPVPGRVNISCPEGVPSKAAPRVVLVCTEEGCDWSDTGGWQAATKHATAAHEGRRVRAFVPHTPEELQEHEREKRRAKKARHRANRKAYEDAHPHIPPQVARGCVCFAAEYREELGKGEVYGALWSKRRASQGAGGGVCVLNGLHGICPAAIWAAFCWAHGVLQCGVFPGDRGSLCKANEELVLYIRDCEGSVGGGSIGVAAALSLLTLVLRLEPAQGVVVTGSLDLCGRVGEVSGLAGKLQACYDRRVTTLLVPSSSWADFNVDEELQGEDNRTLREYAHRAVRPFTTMRDAMQLVFGSAEVPTSPILLGARLERPEGSYWVGTGYSISYMVRTTDRTAMPEPLVVQVTSLTRAGKGGGKGKGQVIVGGVGGENMMDHALAARQWVVNHQKAIRTVLRLPQGSLDWAKEDLLVVFAQGARVGMSLALYTAPIAVAMVSFFTGRSSRRDTSVSGGVSPDDGWACKQPAIGDPVHLQALELQGFTRVVVPEAGDVANGLDAGMAEAGRSLLAADGVGRQRAWRWAPRPEFSLVAMLGHVLETAVTDEEGEDGGRQEEEA